MRIFMPIFYYYRMCAFNNCSSLTLPPHEPIKRWLSTLKPDFCTSSPAATILYVWFCGIKTQLLVYKTNIPLLDQENRISGNPEKTLSLVRCEGHSSGRAMVNLQANDWDPRYSWSNARIQHRGKRGCGDVRTCPVFVTVMEGWRVCFHPNVWMCTFAQNGKLKHTWVFFCSSVAIRAHAICLAFLPALLPFTLDVADSWGSLCPSSLWCSSARCCLGMRRSPPAAQSLVPPALLITWSPKGSQKSFLN